MPKTELKPFEQAMLDAVLEEFADIPSEEDIDVVFSSEFEEKNQELLGDPRPRKKLHLSTGIRRAILIAAIIAALTITAMATPAIREAIIKFFARNEGTHYEFDFDPETAATAPRYILTAYKPYYIPDGYTLVAANCNIGAVMYDWKNADNDYIAFSQWTLPGGSGGPNAEDVSTEFIHLGDYEIFCITAKGMTTYCWTNHEYFFYLTCSSSISEEEMQRIFLSVAVDPDAVIEFLDEF